MYICVLFAAVLLSVQVATGYNHALEPVMPFQPNMAQLLVSSRLTAEDPTKAMKCFADYMRQANEVSQKYSGDYKQCLEQSQQERSEFENEMLNKKQVVVSTTMEVCHRMTECNEMNSTLESFECHAKYGAENSRDVYVVSGNASDFVTVMQEHYRLLDLRHEQCCKMSERSYVKLSADNYRKLHDCLDCKTNSVLPSLNGPEENGETTTTTVVVQQTTETEVPVSSEDTTTTVVAAATTTTDNGDAEVEHSVEVEEPEVVKLEVESKPTEGLTGLLDLLN